jgi:hypothetical protein
MQALKLPDPGVYNTTVPLPMAVMQALKLPDPGVYNTTVPDYGTELLGQGMEGEVGGGPTLSHGSHAGPNTTRPWSVQYLTMAPNCWAMAWKARWGVDPPLAMAAMQALTLPGPMECTVQCYST